MVIEVRVSPGTKRSLVTKELDGSYRVRVDVRAEGGKANDRLIELLAEHFGVSKSCVAILHGVRSKSKKVEILI
ncbi:MAG: DUF167 domain-containing protein [Patescibacteria group bacterium]